MSAAFRVAFNEFGGKFERFATAQADKREAAKLADQKSRRRVPRVINITAHRKIHWTDILIAIFLQQNQHFATVIF